MIRRWLEPLVGTSKPPPVASPTEVALRAAMTAMKPEKKDADNEKDSTLSGSAAATAANESAIQLLSPEEMKVLTGHFRQITQEALAGLGAGRQHEILLMYATELNRFASTNKVNGTSVAEEGVGTSSAGGATLRVPLTSPSEDITRAIASRIHYFHGMEQTMRARVLTERRAQRNSNIYASLLIGFFFIVVTLGWNYFYQTDNALKQFFTEWRDGTIREKRRERRIERQRSRKAQQQEQGTASGEVDPPIAVVEAEL